MHAQSQVRSINFPRKGRWEYDSRGNVTVSAFGIPAEFREAFLKLLVETRRYYRRLFGAQAIGYLEFNVQKRPRQPLRLWTNGADRVYMTLSRKSQLEPAWKSGVRNLHGLTHELAHIVMYRSLINLSELAPGWGEGWAVYVGSFWGVPHLFDTLGEDAWPYPHRYLDSDGPTLYLRRFANRTWSPGTPIDQAVYDLYRLQRRLGEGRFFAFFRELFHQPMRADEFNAEMRKILRLLPKQAA